MDDDHPSFEIGRELADALAAERRHRETGPGGASPLGGVSYRGPREHDLLRFVPSPTDDVVERFVEEFAAASPGQRDRLRSASTLDDFYTLLAFARRAVVRGLRTGSPVPTVRGVEALAAIDPGRIDARDAVLALGLTAYGLTRIGDPGAIGRAMPLATPAMRDLMVRFVEPSAEDAAPGSWGYTEVDTGAGPSLVETGYRPYRPRTALLDAAVAAADVIDGDSYAVTSISIARRLPAVWLPGASSAESEAVIDRSRACVVVNAAHAGTDDVARAQQLTLFVVEAGSTDDSRWLCAMAEPAGHAVLALRSGPVVGLLIARSWVDGVAAVETSASLGRFASGLAAALGL